MRKLGVMDEAPLPTSSRSRLEAKTSAELDAAPQPARVLLAEDLTITSVIARAILEGAGYTVDVVNDGGAAVEAVTSGGNDLVLMDVQMPVLDGASATAKIRALPDARGLVPIVAMTAKTSDEDRCRLLEAGMSGHIGKPFRKNELLEAVALFVR